MADYQHLSPDEIKAMIDDGQAVRIIDVREADEFAICKIEGAELKPLSQFAQWSGELTGSAGPVVLHCHHGMRSQQACDFLSQNGVEGLINMLGGIAQWAESIEPSMRRY